MDRVTESLINDYLTAFTIERKREDIDFEKFVCYAIVSKEYPETFDIENVWVGESPSIDGIAIMLNGRLIEDTEEIKDLLEINKVLEAKFVFIQAKTTSGFDGPEINNFGFGVKDCFNVSPKLTHNDVVKKKITIISEIYKNSGAMTRGLPECKLFYVTTGIWGNDANLVARLNSVKEDLQGLNLFSKVLVTPLGAKEIQEYYYESKRELSVEVTFSNKLLMSQSMDGISEAYIGLLPYSEFSKLIIDANGNLRPVFYDNVRAFQGDNEVNKDIQGTVSSSKASLFAVLNNGITIVAKSITVASNRVTLRNYQVVNGCQTSHVIYNNRTATEIQSVWIPIKLIVTNTEDVTNEIIKATNNQTPVKAEELAALSQFQKDLEAYYKTFTGDDQLHYERRSKQYANDSAINKGRVITIPIQIKVFAAMFLDVPHKVGRYYGTIAREVGADIFHPTHKLMPYFTSALAYYHLENLFRAGRIESKYKNCRFLLLFAFRGLIIGFTPLHFNSQEIDEKCNNMITILNNDQECFNIFNKACVLLDSLLLDYNDRDNFKKQTTTEGLKRKIISGG